jgi:hypothetical protein
MTQWRNLALTALILLFSVLQLNAQNSKNIDLGEIHGNVDINTQYYFEDSIIGAPDVPEQMLYNGFMNLTYTRGNLRAGVRYEAYQNVLLGFSPRYNGSGIVHRYAGYKLGKFDVTAGNFYEQFGNGFGHRSYFEPTIGVDNSIDGFRLKYNSNGVSLTGFIGKQRWYFEQSEGIVRGFNAQIQLNDLVPSMKESRTIVMFGGSATSRYQEDTSPELVLPENVLNLDGRLKISRGGFYVFGEYAYKYNDPSADNGFIYRDGQAIELGTGYSQKGFGFNFTFHSLVNMSFRSDRNNSSQFQELFINFVPSLNKPQTYLLMATLYPYATQFQNEFAFQTSLVYKIPKGSTVGGKYGTTIFLNFSRAQSVDTTNLNDMNTDRLGYTTNLFSPGDEIYWQDANVTIERKFNKAWKARLTYQNLIYNIDVVQGKPDEPNIYANVGVIDIQHNFNRKTALRGELQGLFTEQDQGDWAALVLEFTKSPHWFVSVIDQFNYGNKDPEQRIHYFTVMAGYTNKANRVTLSYGRQREGLFCVGGICRVVPASNGFTLTFSSTF